MLVPYLSTTTATDTLSLSLAIRDLETFLYSPLRGNILGRAFLCGSAWVLYRALVRPEGRASLSDFSIILQYFSCLCSGLAQAGFLFVACYLITQ